MAHLVKRPTLAQVRLSQICEFEPQVRLCADSSEPGACFGFCVCLSVCLSLSLSLSQK